MTAIDGEILHEPFSADDPHDWGLDILGNPDQIDSAVNPTLYFSDDTPTQVIGAVLSGRELPAPRVYTHVTGPLSDEHVDAAIGAMERYYEEPAPTQNYLRTSDEVLGDAPEIEREPALPSVVTLALATEAAEAQPQDDTQDPTGENILATLQHFDPTKQQEILDRLSDAISPETTDLLTRVQAGGTASVQQALESIDSALAELNKPVKPETVLMLGRFASFHTRIYKNGAKHMYGVTEAGKKVHIKKQVYDDWFDTYQLMHTPSVTSVSEAEATSSAAATPVTEFSPYENTVSEIIQQAIDESKTYEVSFVVDEDSDEETDGPNHPATEAITETVEGNAEHIGEENAYEPEPPFLLDTILDRFEALPTKKKVLAVLGSAAVIAATVVGSAPVVKNFLKDNGPPTRNGIVIGYNYNNDTTDNQATTQPSTPAHSPSSTTFKKVYGTKTPTYSGKHRTQK